MGMSAWLHVHGATEALVGSVRQGLMRQGITLLDRENAARAQLPGIIVFAHADAALHEHLRAFSQAGTISVLALDASQDAMPAERAWSLLRNGAADVIRWDGGDAVCTAVAARLQRWTQVDSLMASPVVCANLIGKSPAWRRVLRELVEVARCTDAPVLITGESGTGKELAARLIHTLDTRPNKGELVIVDCTTIMPELSGSEFFGHERGAFTGAIGARDGAFAAAHGGTLFLDEVGELPASMQAQLLRVIQERTYKRVGGNQWLKTDFRLVCATNRNLPAEMHSGAFRADLFYRIAGWCCELPPLRRRREDVLSLAMHFLRDQAGANAAPQLDEAVQRYLLQRDYPGNVRDLRQLMARIRVRHVGNGPITVGDLPDHERPCDDAAEPQWRGGEFDNAVRRAVCMGVKLKELGHYATETAIRLALEEEDGNLQRAARRLGVTDRALQMRRANGQLGS